MTVKVDGTTDYLEAWGFQNHGGMLAMLANDNMQTQFSASFVRKA
jgi:hypothetical protein